MTITFSVVFTARPPTQWLSASPRHDPPRRAPKIAPVPQSRDVAQNDLERSSPGRIWRVVHGENFEAWFGDRRSVDRDRNWRGARRRDRRQLVRRRGPPLF